MAEPEGRLCLGAMATGAGSNTGMLTIQRTAGAAARDSIERVLISAPAHRLDERRVLRLATLATGVVFALYPLAPSAWLMAAWPLVFGATGTLVGAALLFWGVGAAVGCGSWLVRRLGGTSGIQT